MVELLQLRRGSEELEVGLDDLLIATDGGTGLGLGGLQLMYLAGGLVNQGKHGFKGKTLLLKPTLGQGVAVVDEVAGDYGGHMKRLALLTVGLVDVSGEQGGELLELLQGYRATGLNEEADLSEINRHTLTEGLHGVEYTELMGIACKKLHRHTTGGVNPQRLFPSLGEPGRKLQEGLIGKRYEVAVGIHADCIYRINSLGTNALSQLIGGGEGAAIDLGKRHAMGMEGGCEVGSNTPCTDHHHLAGEILGSTGNIHYHFLLYVCAKINKLFLFLPSNET